MNFRPSSTSRSPRSPALPRLARLVCAGALALATGLPAQQIVCMSLHNGPATGLNSLGLPAQVAGRVNGVQVSVPTAAGAPAAAVSAAHQAAFVAAGFATVRINATDFCVVAAPGGGPITSGLCYGTDDMGLDLDSSVAKIPPAGGPPGGDDKSTKPGGAVVPLPPRQQPPRSFGGQLMICFYVWINGTRVRICIPVQLLPGMGGDALQQSIEQQLRQNGFAPNRVTFPDPLQPTQLLDALQVDRMLGGELVDGVEYQYDALSRRIVPNVTGAGVLPTFGGAEFGEPTQGMAPSLPWSHFGDLPPQVNSFFDVFHQVELPNLPGALLIGWDRASLPLLNGWLLLSPQDLMLEFAWSDANGTMHKRWTVPNAPALIGAPLHQQGGVLNADGGVTLSTGIRALIGA